MGEVLGREPRFWGFGGLKPLLMVPGRQSECGGSSDSPRARLLCAPPHGILGTHPREHSELTPNAGRPTPGRTLASPSPPGRLPGGPGAAPDGGSDLVMPRLPVSTRSTGQGICLARSRRVACRTSLRTVQALRYRPVVLRTRTWDIEKFGLSRESQLPQPGLSRRRESGRLRAG